MRKNRTILKEKIRSSVTAVLPVTLIVLCLCLFLAPVSNDVLLSFLLGGVMLVFGMGLFTLGAESAMQPMGEYIGARMTVSRKLWLILLISFFVGTLITVSEPDLTVLASQVPTLHPFVLIIAVGIGVGLFLAVAMLRILTGIRLRYLLIGFYAVVFILAGYLAAFRPQYLAVAFDAGGVTTGPMTVPFLMALGTGVVSIRSDGDSSGDSFGLVSLGSVGPILAVMLLGLLTGDGEVAAGNNELLTATDSRALGNLFLSEIPLYMWDMVKAVAPITVFFFAFQAIVRPMERHGLMKIAIGVGYTYIGLVLFLTGGNVGFVSMGRLLGQTLGSDFRALVIPVGMLIGYVTVRAEPAVHVLAKQVEDATAGALSGKTLLRALEIGVSVSVALAFARILWGIPLLYLILPGYALALALTFIVPPLFTSIAFDAGGVASGPMTAAFLLPFAIGLCHTTGGNIVEDAFGVVAMVAMTPLITVQLLGAVYRFGHAGKKPVAIPHIPKQIGIDEIIGDDTGTSGVPGDDDIIEL